MSTLLMPKSTATWLVENTSLTFNQIAKFCNLHILEINSIADGNIRRVTPLDPTAFGQLTKEEIERCEKDQNAELSRKNIEENTLQNSKHYTPRANRQDRPNGIFWMIENHGSLPDQALITLLGTTRNTIKAIRHHNHWNYKNLKPQNPVTLGLCSKKQLDILLEKYKEDQPST